MSTHGVEELKSSSNTFSLEIQTAVRSELELILSSPAFAQSNRCKRFLSFVVTQTLGGRSNELKERTIGISVFDRPADYDTGGDSIVRVTSNEVRKRISQFYQESVAKHSIQIELPRGSYVPEFRIQPSRNERQGDGRTSAESAGTPKSAQSIPPSVAIPTETSVALRAQIRASDLPETPKAFSVKRSRKVLMSVVAASIGMIAIVSMSYIVWKNEAERRCPQIWDSFESASSRILICIGTHDLPDTLSPPDKNADRFITLVLHKGIIPVDDVSVIASMASLLGKKGIPFRIVGATKATLTDLRVQPVILIGAINNIWTLRLTQDLRYQIRRVDPPRQEPIASIVDSQSPGSTPWTIDFSVPFSEWKKDYGIVARVDDPSTGVPVLIVAGLGNDGNLAGAELLASDALPNQLKSNSSCSGKTNFEAVLETDMIDTKPGPPHILRLQCW